MGNLLRYWPLALVAVAALTGWIAVESWKDRLRAEGRAEMHLARADSVERIAVELRLMAEAIRLERDTVAARYHRARAQLDSVTNQLRTRRPEIVERIVHAPDTAAIRQRVGELVASHEAEVAGYTSALAVADSLLTVERRRGDALSAEVGALKEVNASLRAAIGDTGGPGFVERWGGRIVSAGVGVAAGYVIASR